MPHALSFAANAFALADQALAEFESELGNLPSRIAHVVQASVPAPAGLTAFTQAVAALLRRLRDSQPEQLLTLEDAELRLLRTAVGRKRRLVAEQAYRGQQFVADPDFSAVLSATLEPFEDLLENTVLREVLPLPRPRVSDFLNRRGAEQALGSPQPRTREYDAKHQALLSPALLQRDLAATRNDCEERQLPLAIAFADLDDFKRFNTDLGEVHVDQVVLPPIFRTIERVLYGHGDVYRYGGDEFVLLLPNHSAELVLALGAALRQSLRALSFLGTTQTPLLSIGVWISHPESHLSTTELVQRAETAKKEAKRRGKSQTIVRTEMGSQFVESEERDGAT